jgi:hypothetical protein
MVLSLAVVGLFVAFLVAVTYRPRPDPVRTVDTTVAAAQARDQAPFEPVVPVGLPTTWRATSAGYESARTSSVPNAAHWHVGYVTPAGEYAAVDQAGGDPTVMVRSVVDGARQVGTGTGTFAGWHRWVVVDGRRQGYVLPVGDTTVVVHGTADDAELGTLKDSLRPPPGG